MATPNRMKKRRGGKPPLAERADRHELYEQSVQSPDGDIEFFLARFRQHRGRDPLTLREDFCGTAFLSSVWLTGSDRRTAIGIDFDEETLNWGRARHFTDPGVASRMKFFCQDVCSVTEPRVELACALNFSFCVFKTRAELAEYFAAVYAGLETDGVFVTELYGGTEAIVPIEEEREVDDFTFVWEQEKYNPISNEVLCHMHFSFRDGSMMERAFTYDWRLWTLPEVRELLSEAGFSQVDVYWEETDEDGDGNGVHHISLEEENQESWLVYIAAIK